MNFDLLKVINRPDYAEIEMNMPKSLQHPLNSKERYRLTIRGDSSPEHAVGSTSIRTESGKGRNQGNHLHELMLNS